MAKDNLYEMMVIFDSQGDEAEIRRQFDVVQEVIEKRSTEFIGRAEWGLREFAYPIRKRRAGYYVYYLFRAGVEAPALISNTVKMNEKVLRHLIVRANRSALDYLARMQEQSLPESAEGEAEAQPEVPEPEAEPEATETAEASETPAEEPPQEETGETEERSEETEG